MSLSGRARPGLLLLLLGVLHLGLLPPLRSHARLESNLSVLNLVQSDPLLSIRRYLYLGFILSAITRTPLDLLPLVLDSIHLESPMLLRSSSRLGLALPVPDLLHLDPVLPLQELCRLGSTTLAFGRVSLGSTLPVLDFVPMGSLLLSKSLSRCDSTVLVLDFQHPEPSSFLRSPACSDSTSPMFGKLSMEPPLLTLDDVRLGFFSFLRSYA